MRHKLSLAWAAIGTLTRRIIVGGALSPRSDQCHRLAWLATVVVGFCGATSAQEPRLEFNRDIRPILSDKCFQCHGPDSAARKAELRLDRRDEVIASRTIVPGKPLDSELVRRITSRDDDERMPPKSSGKMLNARETAALARWIEQGAEYQPHWAFAAPRSPALPVVQDIAWVRNPIDRFVLAELERRGLRPSPPADPATLLRRVSLTLNGLPMNRGADAAPLADDYEQAVQRLFESPRYAERMTLDWLDAARYADTNGYFSDFARQAWPWRDWVLKAFASNMPFDQFTIEQLAGDLLPDATIDQRIATAFNRNHMVTDETGVIDEEYRISYVSDRIETTGTVWLGLTLGCAKCHDHKFDPLSQTDYFRLFAYFNNVPETGLIVGTNNPPPLLSLPTADQERQLAVLATERTRCEQQFQAIEPTLIASQAAWLKQSKPPGAVTNGLQAHLDLDGSTTDRGPRSWPVRDVGEFKFTAGVRGEAAVFDSTQYVELAGPPLESGRPFTVAVWLRPSGGTGAYVLSTRDVSAGQRGFEVLWYKGRLRINLVHLSGRDAIELVSAKPIAGTDWRHLVIGYDGSSQATGFAVSLDGKPLPMATRRDSLTGSVANDAPWQVAWSGVAGLGYDGQMDELRLYDRVLLPAEVRDLFWNDVLTGAVARPVAQRLALQNQLVRALYLEQAGSEEQRAVIAELDRIKQREAELRLLVQAVPVMQELPQPRDTFVLMRGQYDQPAAKVAPGIPAALGALSADAPANRLALARWLVSPENPLTARVAVNRLWQQVFGEGLVRSVNDFGLQGELPSHPELLDWLAVEFVRSGWDMRHMLRLMVTSATYHQSSAFTPSLLQIDPENRLLARGPRYRLPAEVIRDQALAVSGLLVERVGGPSVKPYQPPGLWEAVSYNGDLVYEQDHGESLYRRSLYTFWKRQAPPPDMLTFDGPTRETCVVRRPRTNTPLQSLLLLNDVTYVEAARVLATRILTENPKAATLDRVRSGFQITTGRLPNDAEAAAIGKLYERQRASLRENPKEAGRLLAIGEHPVDQTLNSGDLAAWTIVSSVLLNLDETITQH